MHFVSVGAHSSFLVARFLVEEGKQGSPKMMTVGLHCRIVGRPGRAAGLAEFMDYAKSFKKDVWICTREEIAKHWYGQHYPMGLGKSIEEDISPRKEAKEDVTEEEEEDTI